MTAITFISLAACAPKTQTSYVDTANPFLLSTVESFRLCAREAALSDDVTMIANQIFLIKRSLPTAWAEVVDSSGTVVMGSDPAVIASVRHDPLSVESLAYSDRTHPLVRHLWSDDHRPVLDLTLPVVIGTNEPENRSGYVRVGFYAGDPARNWAAPRAGGPASQ